MASLFRLWGDILSHNTEFDNNVFKCFIDRVRMSISHDNPAALEAHFKRLPKDYRENVSEAFRDHALFLLESKKWTNENITAIKKLLHDESMNWQREEVIQSLELISQSHTL